MKKMFSLKMCAHFQRCNESKHSSVWEAKLTMGVLSKAKLTVGLLSKAKLTMGLLSKAKLTMGFLSKARRINDGTTILAEVLERPVTTAES